MGTLIGHVVPGLILSILGIQHLISTIKAYYLKDSNFISKFWYRSDTFPKLKHLELTLVLGFSIFSITTEVVDFHSTSKLKSLEHATMFLQLAIFSGFSLYTELRNTPCSFTSLLGILASSVFGQELFLLHFHSTDHVGLEGHYHGLLQLIVSISFVSSIAMSILPASFVFALVLPVSVIFQGCWFINMGLMLWTPQFVPLGCHVEAAEAIKGAMHTTVVVCGSQEADLRARALANLQFSWILAGILMFTGFGCLAVSSKRGTSPTTVYEELQDRGSDVSVSIDCLKQVQL